MMFPLATNPQLSRLKTSGCVKRSLLAASALCVFAALPLSAQQVTYSSSSNHALLASEDIDGASIASAAAPAHAVASAALPQYGGSRGGGYSGYHESKLSHLAFEVGGGLTLPIGNDVNGGFTTFIGDGNRYGTEIIGANLLAGGGWAFSKRFSLLGEYQFNTNKIPGRTLSVIYNGFNNGSGGSFSSQGITAIGGTVHTHSITAEPVFSYYTSEKHAYTGYVIGGVGWYHKTISFTAPVESYSYYYGPYVTNQTFTSYGDNGLGVNFGTGVSVKPFGSDSHAKLFAEVRYIWANTPRETAAEATDPNSTVLHTGTEELVPITVGLRF